RCQGRPDLRGHEPDPSAHRRGRGPPPARPLLIGQPAAGGYPCGPRAVVDSGPMTEVTAQRASGPAERASAQAVPTHRLYIAGEWVESTSGETFESRN